MAKRARFSLVDGEVVYADTGAPARRDLIVTGNTVYDPKTRRKVGSFGTKNVSPQVREKVERRHAQQKPKKQLSPGKEGFKRPPRIRFRPKGYEPSPDDLVNELPGWANNQVDCRSFARACRTAILDGVIDFEEAEAMLYDYINAQGYWSEIDSTRSDLWDRLNALYDYELGFRYTEKWSYENK